MLKTELNFHRVRGAFILKLESINDVTVEALDDKRFQIKETKLSETYLIVFGLTVISCR
jgi:hypothetical protein